IELWVACVEAAGPLPDEFAEMAETLLGDPYVVVHTAMLRAIPWLGLPDEVVDRLLPTVELWAHAYADRSGWVMDAAVSALAYLAGRSPDGELAERARSLALVLGERLAARPATAP